MSWGVLQRFKPAVDRRWLVLLSAIVWSLVGIMLCVRAWGWLSHEAAVVALVASTAAVVIAVVWHRLMFTKTARKNIERISRLPERTCLFAFTAWKGYGIIAVMVLAGVVLRNSSVPKSYLAPVYIAMGGALALSSVELFRSFWKSRS